MCAPKMCCFRSCFKHCKTKRLKLRACKLVHMLGKFTLCWNVIRPSFREKTLSEKLRRNLFTCSSSSETELQPAEREVLVIKANTIKSISPPFHCGHYWMKIKRSRNVDLLLRNSFDCWVSVPSRITQGISGK